MKNRKNKLKSLLIAGLFLVLITQIIGHVFVETKAFDSEASEAVDETNVNDGIEPTPEADDSNEQKDTSENKVTVEDNKSEDEVINDKDNNKSGDEPAADENMKPAIKTFSYSEDVANDTAELKELINDGEDRTILLLPDVDYEFDTHLVVHAGTNKILKVSDPDAQVNLYTKANDRHFAVFGSLTILGNISIIGTNIAGEEQQSGIYIDPTGEVKVDGASFKNCRFSYGGAIQVNGGSLTLMGETSIEDSVATNNGGGIYGDPKSVISIEEDSNGKSPTISSCSTESGSGGAIYTAGELYMSAGTISDCISQNSGGAIVLEKTEMYFTGGSIINSSSGNGGAIRVQESTLNMSGTAVIDNGYAGDKGGGVYVNVGGTVKMSGGVIKNSHSKLGGGIYIENGEAVMTGDALIEKCTASNDGGGVHVMADGSFTMDKEADKSPTIRECTISETVNGHGDGGGIFAFGSVTINSGNILNCKATTNGGGISMQNASSSLTFNDGLISGCEAVEGGGVFAKNSSFKFHGGKIENCTARDGGGISVLTSKFEQKAVNGMVPEIRDCTANGVPWYGARGGGMYLQGGTSVIEGGIITGCSAALPKNTSTGNIEGNATQIYGSGGGIFANEWATAELGAVQITNNTAQFHGGGVFAQDYSLLSTTKDTEFGGNSAAFWRIPGDNIVNNPNAYPCTSSNGISIDPVKLWGREYPLNNYDINYMSYGAIYGSNGGGDTLNEPSINENAVIYEITPFKNSHEISDTYVAELEILGNDDNGIFKYAKSDRTFGKWSNVPKYVCPVENGGYAMHYDKGDKITFNRYALTAESTYKDLYALWQKKWTIELKLAGDYANLTEYFDISLEYKDMDWKDMSSALLAKEEIKEKISLKHGEKYTANLYEDIRINPLMTADSSYVVYRYIVFDDGTDENPGDGEMFYKTVDEYKQILIVNDKKMISPTGVAKSSSSDSMMMIFIGSGLVLICMCYRKLKKKSI